MMMIGDHVPSYPTVQIPPWDHQQAKDPTGSIHCDKAIAALQRCLPSKRDDGDAAAGYFDGGDSEDFDIPADAFSCDDFRMFEFKVRPCAVARSHDWTECPFSHPGEKARRRDPRKYHYSGVACPDFQRGECRRGHACENAHGVFEAWLHPERYRTQPCKDGTHCRRRVCFFAHTPEQIRVLPLACGSPEASPPLSPSGSVSWDSVSQLSESMCSLQLSKMRLSLGGGVSLCGSLPSWGIRSPQSQPVIHPGFMSLPSTPIQALAQGRIGSSLFDAWGASFEEEPVMERVESGKELREKIYAKIGKENSLERVGRVEATCPDLEWVSELLQ